MCVCMYVCGGGGGEHLHCLYTWCGPRSILSRWCTKSLHKLLDPPSQTINYREQTY